MAGCGCIAGLIDGRRGTLPLHTRSTRRGPRTLCSPEEPISTNQWNGSLSHLSIAQLCLGSTCFPENSEGSTDSLLGRGRSEDTRLRGLFRLSAGHHSRSTITSYRRSTFRGVAVPCDGSPCAALKGRLIGANCERRGRGSKLLRGKLRPDELALAPSRTGS